MSDDTKLKPAAPEAPITMKQVLELIPQMIAASVAATSKPQHAAEPAPERQGKQRCHDCGQVMSACHGKHVQLVVYPQRYEHAADYFPGVFINGVRYLSNHSTHTVTVPAESAGDIVNTVAGFEHNEQELATGRKASRHSGSVGPYGSSVSPASQAWR